VRVYVSRQTYVLRIIDLPRLYQRFSLNLISDTSVIKPEAGVHEAREKDKQGVREILKK